MLAFYVSAGESKLRCSRTKQSYPLRHLPSPGLCLHAISRGMCLKILVATSPWTIEVANVPGTILSILRTPNQEQGRVSKLVVLHAGL